MPYDLVSPALMRIPEGAYGGTTGPDYTRYLTVCVLVIGGILGGAYLVRRLIGESLRRRAAERSLHVVDVLPLGTKQRLCVVQCYDRTFVLGQGEKELRLVAELDPTSVEAKPGPAPRQDLIEPFRSLLAKTQAQLGKSKDTLEPTPPPPGPGRTSSRYEELA